MLFTILGTYHFHVLTRHTQTKKLSALYHVPPALKLKKFFFSTDLGHPQIRKLTPLSNRIVILKAQISVLGNASSKLLVCYYLCYVVSQNKIA